MKAAHAIFLSVLVRWRSYRDDLLAQALEVEMDRRIVAEGEAERWRRRCMASRLVDLTLDGEGEVG